MRESSMLRSILLALPRVFAAWLQRACLTAGCVSLVVTAWGCAPAPDLPTSPTTTPVSSVAVATVEKHSVLLEQTYVGTVTPVRTSTVGSPAEERVVECLFDEADFVKANRGDGALPLVRLRTEPVELKLAAAEAELQVCEHKLQELKLSAPKEIEQAEAREKAAGALMEFTRSSLERARKLHEQRAVSSKELEERRSAAEGAQCIYLERKAARELASSGLWKEKIKQAEACVEVQRQTISQLKDDLAQREIFAPFDGYVTEKHVEVGQWMAEGDPIAEVVDLDDVYVVVPVSQDYVSQLRSGTSARVAIATLPGRVFRGEVVAVVPNADLRSRCFRVKVRLKNPENPADPNDLLLKPGMFVRVTLPVGKRMGLLVAKDSLVLGGASPTVWVAEPESGNKILGPAKVKRVAVEVQLRDSDKQWIEILGPVDDNGSLPIEPGQWVIVEGNERLIPGRPVNIVKIWH